MITKRCSECLQEKPLEAFHAAKLGKFGRRSKCIACLQEYYKQYFKRPDRVQKGRDSSNASYRRLTPAEKMLLMAKIKTRRENDPTHALSKSLRRGLERRPTENPATLSDVLGLWEKQRGCCAVSSLPMTWGKGNFFPTSISIDRIDPTEGYTASNIRLVCYAVNAFKGRWSDDHMIEIARAIVAKADARPKLKLVS